MMWWIVGTLVLTTLALFGLALVRASGPGSGTLESIDELVYSVNVLGQVGAEGAEVVVCDAEGGRRITFGRRASGSGGGDIEIRLSASPANRDSVRRLALAYELRVSQPEAEGEDRVVLWGYLPSSEVLERLVASVLVEAGFRGKERFIFAYNGTLDAREVALRRKLAWRVFRTAHSDRRR